MIVEEGGGGGISGLVQSRFSCDGLDQLGWLLLWVDSSRCGHMQLVIGTVYI